MRAIWSASPCSGHPELSGELRLDGEGHLAMPLVGDVPANGLTTRALEEAIATKLRDENYLVAPQVGVEIVFYRPFYILGEIRRPGLYPYQHGVTVIGAIALAGGYTPRAQTASVMVKGAECTFIARPDTVVLPDDIITVPERFI